MTPIYFTHEDKRRYELLKKSIERKEIALAAIIDSDKMYSAKKELEEQIFNLKKQLRNYEQQ